MGQVTTGRGAARTDLRLVRADPSAPTLPPGPSQPLSVPKRLHEAPVRDLEQIQASVAVMFDKLANIDDRLHAAQQLSDFAPSSPTLVLAFSDILYEGPNPVRTLSARFSEIFPPFQPVKGINQVVRGLVAFARQFSADRENIQLLCAHALSKVEIPELQSRVTEVLSAHCTPA